MTAKAHATGTYAGMCYGGSSDAALISMVNTPSSWPAWINYNLGLVDNYGLDFFEFDFEGSVSGSSVYAFFNVLYDSLQTRRSGNNPDEAPFIVLTVGPSRAASWANLEPFVGFTSLMSYDYIGDWWGRIIHDNAPKSYQNWNGTGTNLDYYPAIGAANAPAPSMQQAAIRVKNAGWPLDKIVVGFDVNPTYWYGGTFSDGRGPTYIRKPTNGSTQTMSSNLDFNTQWPTLSQIPADSIHFDPIAKSYWAHTGTGLSDDKLWVMTALPGRDSAVWATRQVVDSMDIGGVMFWNLGSEVWNTASVPPGGRGWFFSQIRKHFGDGTTPPPPPPGDTTPPSIDLTAPAQGDTVSETVSLVAQASDNSGIASVQFYINGSPLGTGVTAAPWTRSWNTAGLADGSYRIRATATDRAGLKASDSATVVLYTPPPPPPDSIPAGGSDSIVVFGDAIATPWVNGSWGTSITFQSTERTFAGSSAIKAVQNAWGAVSLHSGTWESPVPVAVSAEDFLQLSVYPETDATLRVALQNDLGQQFGYATLSGIPAGRWTTYSLPVRDLNPDNRVIHQLTVQNYVSSAVTYHLDEVKFVTVAAPVDTSGGLPPGGGGNDTVAVVIAGLKYDRLSLDFGNVGVGDQKTDSVTLVNDNDFPVTLKNLRTTSSRFSASAAGTSISPKGSGKVYVTFKPDSRSTFSSLVITSSDTTVRIDTVNIRGTGVRKAKGRFSRGAIAIKPVPNEGTATDSFFVSNDGDVPLELVSVTASKTSISVSPSSGTIAPNDSLKFRVRVATHGKKAVKGFVIIRPAVGEPDSIAVEVEQAAAGVPAEYSLSQNYPNPFNPATTIEYALPVGGQVRIAVFNVIGQEVAVLVDGVQEAGYGEVTFDASAIPSGVYLYRITAGEFTDMKKMLLVR
jgi:hypothetical protein